MTTQDPYAALKQYPQFILWESVQTPGKPKPDKIPCSLAGERYVNAHDPIHWADFETAHFTAELLGPAYGVAFVFTANDPFFVVDIDNCLTPTGWSDLALELISLLPGCLVEVSTSGKGLHLIGSGAVPPHAKKNTPLGIELYSELRFLALGNMETATGSAGLDCTPSMPYIVATYFPQSAGSDAPIEWTSEPCEEWNGIEDDQALIEAMLKSRSGAAMFGGGITFSDLWFADAAALGRNFPSQSGGAWDGSSADASMAQMLAFWTGKNCERMERLMRQSALVRDKWDNHAKYIYMTITNACARQGDVYGKRSTIELPPELPVCKLRGTPKEIDYAEGIRAQVISQTQNPEIQITLAQQSSAKLWINNRDASGEEIARMVTPAPMIEHVTTPTIKTGLQYLAATQQIEYFEGCTYVVSLHKVFTSKGDFLDMGRFNAKYGGYLFQMDESGEKTTKKAWEAFTESQIVSYPHADDTWFRPDMEQGVLIEHEGKTYINTFTPIETARIQGDASPFLNHVAKLLPIGRDQTILLSYMAACVQHIGTKFQWCPLIQGTEGNGKTLLTRCVAKAIGERYTHFPPAHEIAEKFNGWIFTNLFIGVEDIYVSEHKKEVLEVLKPMITGDRLGKRVMNQDPTTGESYANFMLNSNHKDAIRKTENDRRFCVFYTAQQEAKDLHRDGMDGDYMPKMYEWLKSGGYAIVNDFLRSYQIPEEFNPAGTCHRAPHTSSTLEAVGQSMGSIEHLIVETIEEDGFVGMRRGWISSVALDRLLRLYRKENVVPLNKRKGILESLGYEQHPHLTGGRVNNNIAIDDGKKPYLYVKVGSEQAGIVGQVEIVKAYTDAQVGVGHAI